MAYTITKSIDTVRIIVENDNGVDYIHIKRSTIDDLDKGSYLFVKGNEEAGLKFLNSIATLLGMGPITREENK